MALSSRQVSNYTARAAAILTTSTVNTTPLDIHRTIDGWVQVFIDFTVGSLTNATFNPQILGSDGTWRDCSDPGVLTLTASGHKAFAVCAKGAKQLRVGVLGSGTVTSSSATVTYGWQEAGGAVG